MIYAAAATRDLTPTPDLAPQFLFGYPHVERHAAGVHDPLLASALALGDGVTRLIFVANDIIFVPRDLAARARERIEAATGIPSEAVMLTATHTHSGPITVDYLSNADDPIVPRADPAYLRFFEDQIVAAAVEAAGALRPAQLCFALADGSAVGTNRRDPAGPADPQVPVLLARAAADGAPIAVMLVCSMHPTVLHEDSKLVSADFPGATRRAIQGLLGADVPVLHHTGPAGNQSPRHVTRGNTFAEAERLGRALGEAVLAAVHCSTAFPCSTGLQPVPPVGPAPHCSTGLQPVPPVSETPPGSATPFGDSVWQIAPQCSTGLRPVLQTRRTFIDLPHRPFPPVAEAAGRLAAAQARLAALRAAGAPATRIRTAEVDGFGTEETVTLARAAADGRLDAAYAACLPAEVQALTVGPWTFIGWPGEVFVEYALEVKARRPGAFVISLANGELQGYIVTEEAAREGGYEASNGLFPPEAGRALVEAALGLLGSR